MRHFAKSIAISTTIFFLSLLIANLTYSSDTPAVELLKKSYTNQRLVSHTGMLNTVVFLGEEAVDEANMSIVEVRQKDGRMQMDYKSGIFAGLSIIGDGNKMMRVDSKNRTAVVSAIPFSQDDISLLLSNYEVILEGTEQIDGRPTQILQVKSRNIKNPSKKLWIDKETFMPLRSEHYNSDGVLTTLTFYTQVNYDVKIKDSDFSPPKGCQIVEAQRNMQKFSREQISETVGFDIVEPKYLPSGYVLDGLYLFYPMHQRKGVHIRYVDGLNTISVFECSHPHFGRGMGRMRRMRHGWQDRPKCEFLDNRQGRAIRMMKGDLNITLVADIAEAELQKISDSF
jgi:outer membrane lipoprotein-sorting protein